MKAGARLNILSHFVTLSGLIHLDRKDQWLLMSEVTSYNMTPSEPGKELHSYNTKTLEEAALGHCRSEAEADNRQEIV